MAKYFVAGGVDNLYGTSGNWAATDGGAGGTGIPAATDDVFFTANSPSTCSVAGIARLGKTLNTTGWTGTLSLTTNLNISGSITIGTGTAWTNNGGLLRMITTGTWTTNGVTIGVGVEIGGTTTFTPTLADALVIGAALTLTNTTSTPFSGSFSITANSCTISGTQTVTPGSNQTFNILGLTTIADACVLTANGSSVWNTYGLTTTGALTGTQGITFNGTGTWTGAAGAMSNSFNINTAGTLSLSGTILWAASGTPTGTYTGGTVSAGTSVFSIGSSATLNTAGMSFFDVTISAAATLTLSSRLTGTGTLTEPNANITYAGSSGWTFATRTSVAYTASRTVTYQALMEYIVTAAQTQDLSDTQAETHVWTSSHATDKALFTLRHGATQNMLAVVATRMDARRGQTVSPGPNGSPISCFNFGSGSLTGGQPTLTVTDGATATLSGITADFSGTPLSTCTVYLCRDNGNSTMNYIATTTSAGDGTFSFAVYPSTEVSTYFLVAFKDGAPANVMDVSERTLSGT